MGATQTAAKIDLHATRRLKIRCISETGWFDTVQAAYNLAQEYGLNVFYGGHYQTETFGVKALGDHLGARFGLPTEFIDIACPF